MWEILKNFGALVGAFVIGSAAITTVTYWLFKLFSEKWLNNKFAERLEAFKHQQSKEMEHLRFQINSLMDRTVKLHQNEFEVLPSLWSKLVFAHAHVQGVTSGLQSYPDIDQMNDAQLSDFLLTTELASWEVAELKAAGDKNKYYQRAANFKRANKARGLYVKFHSYLRRKGIFVQPEMREEFEQLSDLLNSTLVEHELRLESSDFRSRDASRELSAKSPAALKSLEAKVQARLWSANLDIIEVPIDL